jgi:hypothetical protein
MCWKPQLTSRESQARALTTASVAGTFDCGTLNRSDDGGGSRTMTVTNGAFDIKF